jgi:hypothetical protein
VKFDVALIEAATGMAVEHRECMARGGASCRFTLVEPDAGQLSAGSAAKK